MLSAIRKNLIPYLGCLLIVATLALAPFSPTFHYQKAEAGGIVYDPTNWVQNNVTAVSTSANAILTGAIQWKELVGDGIAWTLINVLLQEMIRSVTDWVNNGFPSGGPAFVRNFGEFFTGIADGVLGDFLADNFKLAEFMCSPFKLDIQATLDLQFNAGITERYNPQCRVSDILNNVKDFSVDYNADANLNQAYNSRSFASGGWDWWMAASTNQEGNVFGAYSLAQAALTAELRNARGEKIELLRWGEGFLSFEKCNSENKDCKIETPGSVIEAQLNSSLDSSKNRIEVADEINELIAALLGQLMQTIFSSGGGLFSASSPGGSIDTLQADTRTRGFGVDDADRNALYDQLQNEFGFGSGQAIETESYIGALNRVINTVNEEARTLFETRKQVPLITTTELPSSITDIRDDAIVERDSMIAIQTDIEALRTDLESATTEGERTAIQSEIDALQDLVPSTAEVTDYYLNTAETLESEIIAFRRQVNSEINLYGGTANLLPLTVEVADAELTLSPPLALITLSPTAQNFDSSPTTVTVTWDSYDAESCTASNSRALDGWSGAVDIDGGETSLIVGSATTFTITCENEIGTTEDTAQIFNSG